MLKKFRHHVLSGEPFWSWDAILLLHADLAPLQRDCILCHGTRRQLSLLIILDGLKQQLPESQCDRDVGELGSHPRAGVGLSWETDELAGCFHSLRPRYLWF